MNDIPVAPYEVASHPEALPKGKYLYFRGKKYLRPTLTDEEFVAISNDILNKLNVCNNQCKGLTRLWHTITRNPGHIRERS